jgi:predicted pyridoxine 5'-phosphate oxidase superfamily flavin-nucleotide-binding protein
MTNTIFIDGTDINHTGAHALPNGSAAPTEEIRHVPHSDTRPAPERKAAWRARAMRTFAELAFTPAVRALQERDGSRAAYARRQSEAGPGEGLGPREAEHIANADSLYMATVSETGWPYVQHRGGPRGFVRIVSPSRLAFADFRGNRQLVSAGNVSRDDRVSLIVMDYPNRRRLKLLGRLRFQAVEDADPALAAAVEVPGYRARVERIAVIDVEAFDWNCSQHITQRFTRADIEVTSKPLHARIEQLEAELAALRRTIATKEAQTPRVG